MRRPTFEEWEQQSKTGWMVPNEELAPLILPWAKQHHPDKYDLTLKVARIPETFRAYMLRLVELRGEAEGKEFLRTVPLSVLDETGIVLEAVHKPTGTPVTVCGMKAKEQTGFRFFELALPAADFLLLLEAKRTLDLEYSDGRAR